MDNDIVVVVRDDTTMTDKELDGSILNKPSKSKLNYLEAKATTTYTVTRNR